MGKKQKVTLGLLLLMALAVRIFYIASTPQGPLSSDALGYHQAAVNLLEKGSLGMYSEKPNAFVTPGYPFFLAGIYSIFGSEDFGVNMVRYIQAVLSIISLYLLFLLAYKLSDFKSALIALIIGLLYTPFVQANVMILTEVLFTFLLTLVLYLLYQAFNSEKPKYFALVGLLLGIATLVRPTPSMFLPVIIFLLVIRKRKVDLQVIKLSVAVCLSFVLIMTPWWIRNFSLYDRFIPFSNGGGYPLLLGAHPWYKDYDKTLKMLPKVTGEIERERIINAKTKEIILKEFKENPVKYLYWFTVGKFSYLWAYIHLDDDIVFSVRFVNILVHLPVVILGWFWVLKSIYQRKQLELSLFVVYFTFLHMVYLSISRYSFPLMPLMIIFAVIIANDIKNGIKNRYIKLTINHG